MNIKAAACQTCASFGVAQSGRRVADVLALKELLPELDKPRIARVTKRRQTGEVFVETCNSHQHSPVF